MPLLFWLDIIFLGISTVAATALALIALGAGITSGLNRSFAVFALMEAAWALLSIMLRLSLWLAAGNPLLLIELATLAFGLMGPSLFIFTAHYVKQRSHKTDLITILGVVFIAILTVPLFQHNIISAPHLNINGSTRLDLSLWGLLVAIIPLAYILGSLFLFWRARRHLGELYLALSVFILLLGFVLGGILDIAVPILSITNTLSVILLGYGVISQQLFNPLRERTIKLQHEITERARIEAALRKSEERLRILLQKARDALYLHDEYGKLIEVNKAACTDLGYSREELLNLNVLDIDTTFDLEGLERLWGNLNPDDAIIIETTHQRKDGSIFPVEVNIAKFPLEDQMVFLALARDITNRRQTQEQLRKLWRAIEQSHNTVVITNTQGQIEYSNPKFTELTGYSLKEILGQSSNILKSGQHPPEFYRQLWDTIESGEVWQGEFHNMKKNGELYWEFAAISPVRDTAGQITHYVKVAEDITNRKQTEEALLQASRMETAATLAGGVAHKVNNLMTAVLGYAELLKSQLGDNPEALNILTTISTSARQTGDLAQEMLAFARGGKYQLRILNLNKIIQEVLQLRQRDLPAQIEIEQNLTLDLWNTEADPTQMSQVILNLLTNAVEAVEDKGRITITTENLTVDNTTPNQSDLEPGPYICCTVQDTGCGMDADILARVFEPFFTTKFQGRGMGLAAVFGIVKNHGGQITVTSQPGLGSIFKIYLPATKTETETLPDGQPAQEASPTFGTQEQKTILIVEDDPVITEIVRKMLTLLGHQPLVAGNGQEAVEIAQSFKKNIDLTLLDLGLPVVNGAEAYPLLMEAQPEMKVIIYSGYELDEIAQAILDAGASAFIKKPFHLDVLKAEIHKALNS